MADLLFTWSPPVELSVRARCRKVGGCEWLMDPVSSAKLYDLLHYCLLVGS